VDHFCLFHAHPVEPVGENEDSFIEDLPYYSLNNKEFLEEACLCSPINTKAAPLLLIKHVNFNLNIHERNPLGYDEQIDPDSNLFNESSYDAVYADPNTLKQ